MTLKDFIVEYVAMDVELDVFDSWDEDETTIRYQSDASHMLKLADICDREVVDVDVGTDATLKILISKEPVEPKPELYLYEVILSVSKEIHASSKRMYIYAESKGDAIKAASTIVADMTEGMIYVDVLSVAQIPVKKHMCIAADSIMTGVMSEGE